jgi:hypothetical protein
VPERGVDGIGRAAADQRHPVTTAEVPDLVAARPDRAGSQGRDGARQAVQDMDRKLRPRPGRQVVERGPRRIAGERLRLRLMAGLDPGDVLAAAISERDPGGARDLAAVIDARIRYRTGALVPAPTGPWSFQVPAIADATRHAYLTRRPRHARREAAVPARHLPPSKPPGHLSTSATNSARSAPPPTTPAWPGYAPRSKLPPPGQHRLPLRFAEPDPATDTQRAELTLTAEHPPGEMSHWITDLTAACRTFGERLADRQSMTIPAEDPTYGDLGRASRSGQGRAGARSCSRPSGLAASSAAVALA